MEVQLSKARRDIAAAELKVKDAALGHCEEKAPFAGRVAQVFIKAHQWVEPGQPLMVILNPTRLEAECIVPSKWLRWLKVGHAVDILVDETGKTVHATVEAVSPHVDPVSQTVRVRATVQTTPDLLPGMSGTAAFHPPR